MKLSITEFKIRMIISIPFVYFDKNYKQFLVDYPIIMMSNTIIYVKH